MGTAGGQGPTRNKGATPNEIHQGIGALYRGALVLEERGEVNSAALLAGMFRFWEGLEEPDPGTIRMGWRIAKALSQGGTRWL